MSVQTEIIDVTLLQVGDYFYPVLQATGERYIEEGLLYVSRAPKINHSNGTIEVGVVGRYSGHRAYENGAKVAREVLA